MIEYRIERLTKHHDRRSFRCGVDELDRWLKERARQDQERYVAAVYVCVRIAEPARIAGFYTLSSASIVLADLPNTAARTLPRYPLVPAVLIGRLARDVSYPGLGSHLLVDALVRACRSADEIAAAAVVVDAIDDTAKAFYERHGFTSLSDTSKRLYLPISTAKKLFD